MMLFRLVSLLFSRVVGPPTRLLSTTLRVLLGSATRAERRLVVGLACQGGGVVFLLVVGFSLLELDLFAADPWSKAVKNVCTAFKTTIGKGLALVAVVIAGLMFAFGEGGSKSAMAGLIFGAAMVLGAPAFLTFVGYAGDC